MNGTGLNGARVNGTGMNGAGVNGTVEAGAAFVMVVPPGWARLPARPAERKALLRLIDGIVAEALPEWLPRDSAEPWRGEFRKRLLAAVSDAGENGAEAVVLPVRPVNGVTVPASWVEAETIDDEATDPAAVVAALLDDSAGSASLREVDGAAAVRTDETRRDVRLEGDWPVVTTRQIVYRIAVPHLPGRWVVLSFSAVSGDSPSTALSDALVQLFDALLTTFRWTDVPGGEESDLDRRLAEIRPA